MDQQKIYNVVKSTMIRKLYPREERVVFTPWSVVTEVLQIEDPWTLPNLAENETETIGTFILGLAAKKGDIPNYEVRLPLEMILNHYQEIMPVLAANPHHMLDTHMWTDFLWEMPVEHAQEHGYGFQILEKVWKVIQRGGDANSVNHDDDDAYHHLMIRWGMIPDSSMVHVAYQNLPAQLRVPKEEVSLSYMKWSSPEEEEYERNSSPSEGEGSSSEGEDDDILLQAGRDQRRAENMIRKARRLQYHVKKRKSTSRARGRRSVLRRRYNGNSDAAYDSDDYD